MLSVLYVLYLNIQTSADSQQLSLTNMYDKLFLCALHFSHLLPSFFLDSMRAIQL